MAIRATPGRIGASVAVALVLLALGGTLALAAYSLIDSILSANMVLRPTSKTFGDFVTLPFPIVDSIYFFNVTNADAVANGTAKPVLVEVGPYVYHERHTRENITFTHANGTVSFSQRRTYHFQPELSAGDPSDEIVTLDPVMAAANLYLVNAHSDLDNWWVGGMLDETNSTLFIRKNVSQLLFEGYHSPFLEDAGKTPTSFAYYLGKNGSDSDGTFNMYTGEAGIANMSNIARWNFDDHMPFYKNECSIVRGGSDTVPPGRQKTFVEIFTTDLCRPLRMVYNDTITSDGLETYRYRLTDKFFANTTQNPANWCFDPKNRRLPSGVFDAGPCLGGKATILMSQPHFFQADPWYLSQVKSGLSPDAERHGTTYVVEPMSGVPTRIVGRFQINFLLKWLDVDIFSNIKEEMIVPTVWAETRVDVPADALGGLGLLQSLPAIFVGSGVVLIVLSLGFVALAAAGLCLLGKVEHALEDEEDLLGEAEAEEVEREEEEEEKEEEEDEDKEEESDNNQDEQ